MPETIIADSSVAVKWFTDEPDDDKARTILRDAEQGTLRLRAPGLIYAEFGNVLWKKQRSRNMTDAEVTTALTLFQAVPFLVTPDAELIEDALRLAVAHGRSVYDCLYLALSVRENCRFVTADEKLVNVVSAALPTVTWLAQWA